MAAVTGRASDAASCAKSGCQIVDVEELWVVEAWRRHRQACEEEETFYEDPQKRGAKVFTEFAHKKRGRCCGSGCRHCPFAHDRTKMEKRAENIYQPAWLHISDAQLAAAETGQGARVLLYRGCRASFLALRALLGTAGVEPCDVVLLTSFDAITRKVAPMGVHIATLQKQAKHLDVSLIGVPLFPGLDALARLQIGLTLVSSTRPLLALAAGGVQGVPALWPLVFGQVETPRAAPPAELGTLPLEYPLWEAGFEELSTALQAAGLCFTPEGGGDSNQEPLAALGLHELAEVWKVDPGQALGVSMASARVRSLV